MKTYKKIAIIAYLSLIPLSVFSMDIALKPKESNEDKELRKKLYAWHAGNQADKLKNAAIPWISNIVAQLAQFAVNRVTGSKKQLTFNKEKKFLEESCDSVYEKLTNMGTIPKKIDLTFNERSKADNVLRRHSEKLKSKIIANKNPLQAKWKNMAKAVAVTGATFGLAYCYLHNKQAVNELLGNNFISHNAMYVAQHYYEAPYRPFTTVMFDGITSDAVFHFLRFGSFGCGSFVSRLVRLFIDQLTGFTHFVPSGQNFLGLSKNGLLYDVLSGLFFGKPAAYVSNQFSKVWYYKSDLIKRKDKDEEIYVALFNAPLEKGKDQTWGDQDDVERKQRDQSLNMWQFGGNGTGFYGNNYAKMTTVTEYDKVD